MQPLRWLPLILALHGCAGEEKSPLPYYGTSAQGGTSGAAGTGGTGGTGGSSSGGAPAGGSAGTGVAPTGAVVLNEIDPSGSPVDWVELVNRGEQAADVSGWSVVQGFEEGTAPTDDDRLRIPAGTILEPGARLVLFTRLSDGPGPGDFGIGKDAAERITLLDPGDTLVDDTTTDGSLEQPFGDGISWARLPDGEGPFARGTSTQGTTNAP